MPRSSDLTTLSRRGRLSVPTRSGGRPFVLGAMVGFVMTLATPAVADTYYVATGGDDAAVGTSAEPFRTCRRHRRFAMLSSDTAPCSRTQRRTRGLTRFCSLRRGRP